MIVTSSYSGETGYKLYFRMDKWRVSGYIRYAKPGTSLRIIIESVYTNIIPKTVKVYFQSQQNQNHRNQPSLPDAASQRPA